MASMLLQKKKTPASCAGSENGTGNGDSRHLNPGGHNGHGNKESNEGLQASEQKKERASVKSKSVGATWAEVVSHALGITRNESFQVDAARIPEHTRKLLAAELRTKTINIKDLEHIIGDDGHELGRQALKFIAAFRKEVSAGVKEIAQSRNLSGEEEKLLFFGFNYYRLTTKQEIDKLPDDSTPSTAHLNRIRAALAGSNAIESFLAEKNIGLVFQAAKAKNIVQSAGDDAISEGMAAVLRAIDGFEASRGWKFSTYAMGAILRAYSRAYNMAMRNRPSNFSDADGGAAFIETTDNDGRNHREREHFAGDEDYILKRVKTALETLNDREREMLLARTLDESERMHVSFGNRSLAGQGDPLTLGQVGEIFDLTRERVRQIQNRAILKLRKELQDLVDQGLLDLD